MIFLSIIGLIVLVGVAVVGVYWLVNNVEIKSPTDKDSEK